MKCRRKLAIEMCGCSPPLYQQLGNLGEAAWQPFTAHYLRRNTVSLLGNHYLRRNTVSLLGNHYLRRNTVSLLGNHLMYIICEEKHCFVAWQPPDVHYL
jgi:hypothetical protein